MWVFKCSANVCYAKLVVYTLARTLRTLLDIQGNETMPTWLGGAEGQRWLPTSTSEGVSGITDASVAEVVD